MNRIYLLRHGIAVNPGTPGIEDDDRPLTGEGEKRIRQVARGLRRLGVKLDKVIASPLPRAYRTAEIVVNILKIPDLLEAAEPLHARNGAAAIREWLATRTEDRLMLVGHNPSLTNLIGLLVPGQPAPAFCDLKKGGIAAFSSHPTGDYRLDWLARPRLFRRL